MFNSRKIKKAKQSLEQGDIVLCPTDTIWGLSCDSFNEKAVNEIFDIKRRPKSKKLLILVDSYKMLGDYVEEPSEFVLETMRATHPVTIVYDRTKNLPDYLLSVDKTVAIRITKDPNLKKLISSLGHPIISTSANIGGQPFPKSFKDIDKSIIKSSDYILRLKENKNSYPSKILKLEGDNFRILRS